MDNAGYVNIARQSGLMRQLQMIANNVANISTTGYRRGDLVFAEFITPTGQDNASISMPAAVGRITDTTQGALAKTGNPLDFAIEGRGYFQIDTPDGMRLTRAGAFTPNAEGELVTPDGLRVLDSGGAPIFIPPDAKNVTLAPDGTLSADGVPLAQLGIVMPAAGAQLSRRQGVMFAISGDVIPVTDGRVIQGFLEQSNVNPVTEISRLIEIQRGYELGQKFLDREDERIRSVIRTLGQ